MKSKTTWRGVCRTASKCSQGLRQLKGAASDRLCVGRLPAPPAPPLSAPLLPLTPPLAPAIPDNKGFVTTTDSYLEVHLLSSQGENIIGHKPVR